MSSLHSRQDTYYPLHTHLECTLSHTIAPEGGELGAFSPGDMQKTFEEAAFGLGVGEISGVVDSESGVHLILRTA